MEQVYAADWVFHGAAGGVLGLAFSPIVAFGLGFISHCLIDMYFYEFSPTSKLRFWWWYVFQFIVIIYIIFSSQLAVVFGIIGAILPDVIDGTQGLLLKPDGKLNVPRALSRRGLEEWFRRSRWHHGIFPIHRYCPMRVKKMMSFRVNLVLSLSSLFGFLGLRDWLQRRKKTK